MAQFDPAKNRRNGDQHVWTFAHNYTLGNSYIVSVDLENWVSELSLEYEFVLVEQVDECP